MLKPSFIQYMNWEIHRGMKNRTITKIANIKATTIKAKMRAKSSSSPRRSLITNATYFAIDGSTHIPHAEGKVTEQVNTILLTPSDQGCLVCIVNFLKVSNNCLTQEQARTLGSAPKGNVGLQQGGTNVDLIQFLSFHLTPSQGFQPSASHHVRT